MRFRFSYGNSGQWCPMGLNCRILATAGNRSPCPFPASGSAVSSCRAVSRVRQRTGPRLGVFTLESNQSACAACQRSVAAASGGSGGVHHHRASGGPCGGRLAGDGRACLCPSAFDLPACQRPASARGRGNTERARSRTICRKTASPLARGKNCEAGRRFV
jgi:hypothetical protein